VETAWPLLERSMLLRVQQFRLDAWWLRGRVWLAAAAQGRRPTAQRMVKTAIKRIERENMTWSAGHAASLRAGLAQLEGDRLAADRLLYGAAQAYDVARMRAHAAACRVNRGLCAPGQFTPDGARGMEALREQHVVSPERFASTFWPVGLVAPRSEVAAGPRHAAPA
jgi:hypothetical protein